ncbi:hypothetical protein EDB84DRAFT_1434342 [Lactarius hengduanensis]|nr:hypothetical protein EDB84DRAFT_1434342 [Lactarius hengduanensis]
MSECGTQMSSTLSSTARFALWAESRITPDIDETRLSYLSFHHGTAADHDQKMTVRVATGGDTGTPIANADCPEVYRPCLNFVNFITREASDPEGDILGGRPSHGHCGKICGCHHSYTSSYSIGSAFGAEAREVNTIIFLSWRTIEKNNGEPPQEGIRLHSGIVRWFGECVPGVAFVCPQASGEPGAAAGHCTGGFAKTHVIYRILAACFRQRAITSAVVPFIMHAGARVLYPLSFGFWHESTGAHGGGSSLT